MPLPTPPVTQPTWPAQIRDVVEGSGELSAVIDIAAPSTGYAPYDPVTDTGGPGATTAVITGRAARVQAQGEPAVDSTSWDGTDSIERAHLIQFVDEVDDPEILANMIATVTSVGPDGDPFLIGKKFIIEASGGSSSHALRTLRCWAVT